MAQNNVLIGMSGGVDSSVAAHLLLEQGLDCAGAAMTLCSDVSADAQKVAQRLGIPFHMFDLQQEFDRCVVAPFVNSYEQGLTPNPCIECNKHLKFDLFLQQARNLGCDLIATGHYARIGQDENGRYQLYKAADESKDQSYFLYTLTQQQLAHVLFPLGELSKLQVREIALEQGFINAQKRDSQDICFIPDGDYKAFLERYTGKTYKPGNYLDLDGNVVGKHTGAVGYTLGQRKGLGIAMGQPVYVCAKDMQRNTVTVGAEDALMHNALTARDFNWIAFDRPSEPFRANAKTRSRQKEQPAWVYALDDGTIKVVFDQPQRAITPGQAVVLYDGETVLGGGTIFHVFSH